MTQVAVFLCAQKSVILKFAIDLLFFFFTPAFVDRLSTDLHQIWPERAF